MSIKEQQNGQSTSDSCEADREVIRLALDEIADEIAIAMRDADLSFAIGITVPSSGTSIASICTPLDPSDEDWAHATRIICSIMGKRLGDVKLWGRQLPCAMAQPKRVNAVEVTADTMGNS